jgi:hypothetical protein
VKREAESLRTTPAELVAELRGFLPFEDETCYICGGYACDAPRAERVKGCCATCSAVVRVAAEDRKKRQRELEATK